jgi:hypothetical protein
VGLASSVFGTDVLGLDVVAVSDVGDGKEAVVVVVVVVVVEVCWLASYLVRSLFIQKLSNVRIL